MANIGLTNIWFANLTEAADGTATYDGAKNLGKAVSCTVDITNNEATLYGDDAIAESDTTFASGSITLGVTNDDDTIFAPLLGHTLDSETGEVIKTSADTAPWVGIGRIVTKMVNAVYVYKVEFLYKVKFSEPSRDENTRGESIEFATPSIDGVIATLEDERGTWGKSKTFNTKSDALTYLQGLLAAPTP
jgi:phi13 family phage major tail protein